MQVNQFLIDVMRMVGRADAAEICLSEEDIPDEIARMRTALLLCLNAVLDELARGYFPVKAREDMSSADGEYAFSSFAHTPYRINRVLSGGKKVKWRAQPLKLLCNAGNITVEYEYVPDALTLESQLSYPHPAVGDALISYGVAAEYMLIEGDISCAEMWESKYRTEIDRQLSLLPVRGRIPPRRWI